MVVGLEIDNEQLVDGVAVLGNGEDDVLAVVRDVRAGAVGGVGGVEVDEDVIGLRSSNLVVEPARKGERSDCHVMMRARRDPKSATHAIKKSPWPGIHIPSLSSLSKLTSAC